MRKFRDCVKKIIKMKRGVLDLQNQDEITAKLLFQSMKKSGKTGNMSGRVKRRSTAFKTMLRNFEMVCK